MTVEFKLYPKQKRALMSSAQEILYGGAAGAGFTLDSTRGRRGAGPASTVNGRH